jgi:hypothetical protein
MTLRRAQIMSALQARLQTVEVAGLSLFADLAVDAEETEGWRALTNGLTDSCNLLSGKFEPTIDSGPEEQWEGVRECTLIYAVDGAERDVRQAQRDLAVPAVEALLQADRTIGAGDPQVYAQLGPTTEDDNGPVRDAAPASVAVITIFVTYVAASAAG